MSQDMAATNLAQIVIEQIHDKGPGTIKLIDCNLGELPKEVIDIIKDYADKLSVPTNSLKSLPSSFNKLTRLTYLDIHDNNFAEFPNVICQLPNLEILDISDNQLRTLPTKIKTLRNLKALSLKNNNFEYISPVFSEMSNLKMLEINGNPLIMPTVKLIDSLQKGTSEWIVELKKYLKENRPYLDSKIQEIEAEDMLQRSKSVSEVKQQSTRASKRMGLFIRRPDDLSNKESDSFQSVTTPTISTPSSATARSRSSTISKEYEMLEKNGKIDTEHKSGAYFRRLSTLQEVSNSLSQIKIINGSRKILFSFSELHSSIRRVTGFCSDKKVTTKMVNLLFNAKTQIDHLVESLVSIEENSSTTVTIEQVLASVSSSINLFKSIMTLLQENFISFTINTDVCFMRMFLLTTYGSLNELFNAYKIFNPLLTSNSNSSISTIPQFNTSNSNSKSTLQSVQHPHLQNHPNAHSNNLDSEDVDEKLYESLDIATLAVQVVFNELSDPIDWSALQNVQHDNSNNQINQLITAKVKEISVVLKSTMEITKRIRTKLVTIRTDKPSDKKKFLEDVNLFLKATLNILHKGKQAMIELPILNDVSNSLAVLTRASKDVASILKSARYANDSSLSQGNSNPQSMTSVNSVTNMLQHQQQQQQLSSHSISMRNTPVASSASSSMTGVSLLPTQGSMMTSPPNSTTPSDISAKPGRDA